MDFEIACKCGKRRSVAGMMAGTCVRCECGVEIQVPPLSELRRQAGVEPYVTSALDQIQQLLDADDLPAGSDCLLCHAPTHETVYCEAVCERSWKHREYFCEEPGGFTEIMLFFFPVVLLCLIRAETAETMGRDIVVPMPFRLRPACQRTSGVPRRSRRLKELLRAVPVYQEVLRDYPRTKIRIVKTV